jgi:hypothetical protein
MIKVHLTLRDKKDNGSPFPRLSVNTSLRQVLSHRSSLFSLLPVAGRATLRKARVVCGDEEQYRKKGPAYFYEELFPVTSSRLLAWFSLFRMPDVTNVEKETFGLSAILAIGDVLSCRREQTEMSRGCETKKCHWC